MNRQEHGRIKEIFLAACDLPLDQRDEFLKKKCGDDRDLKTRVEQLLHFHLSTASDSGDQIDLARSAEPWHNFLAGTMIAQRYRIVALLGRGGMGEVYRAQDTTLDQTIALKFLPVSLASHPVWLMRMYQEVRIAREVTHPNVCRTFDIDKSNSDHFISMEYVAGEDLKTLLERIGRLPQEKVLDIARQLCAGLWAAHAKSVLHRDLKPANIMLDERGRVRIMDFGLAASSQEIDQSEIRAGTPAYMAPEQLAGTEVTVRSDIYALGLVLYELSTGQPAFRAQTAVQFARLKESSAPSLPSSIIKDVDPTVERVILRCLEKDPSARPASVMEVAAALPGGDLLSAAVAAGETPSPEMVAAASAAHRIRPIWTSVALMAFFLLLAFTFTLSPWVHPILKGQGTKSPQVLGEKARDIVRQVLPDFQYVDESYGFTDQLEARLVAHHWDRTSQQVYRYLTADDASPVFWYRSSDQLLVPSDPMNVVFDGAQVTQNDPNPTHPGMVNLVLDSKGKLLAFEVVPNVSVSAGQSVGSVDWSDMFVLANLDRASFEPTVPQLVPHVWTDVRAAWVGQPSESPGTEIRVEAAGFRGQPVFFAVVDQELRTMDKSWITSPALRRVRIAAIRQALLAVLIIVCVPLMRLNLASGRSDLQGALRLATLIFVLQIIVHLFQAHYVASSTVELQHFALAAVGAFIEAAIVWLFYIALEPYVRRFWPHSIISWSRLIAGHVANPLLGHNVLLGSILGVFWALMFSLDRVVSSVLAIPVREAIRPLGFFSVLLGPRHGFAFFLDALCQATYEALFFLLIVVLLRIVLRRSVLAGLAAVVLTAPFVVPQGSNPFVSGVFLGLGVVTLAVWMLMRFGLVTVTAAVFVAMILIRFPLTLNMRAWYGDMSLFAFLVVVGLALSGFTACFKRPSTTM